MFETILFLHNTMFSICICGLESLTEACEDMVYSMNLNVEELEWFK